MLTQANKDAIMRLVAALESEEYEQTVGALHIKGNNGSRFCVLGVACDTFKKDIGGKWDGEYFVSPFRGVVTTNAAKLPPALREKLGLGPLGENYTEPQEMNAYGVLDAEWNGKRIAYKYGDKKYGTLSYMNDTGLTFDAIASVLRDLVERS